MNEVHTPIDDPAAPFVTNLTAVLGAVSNRVALLDAKLADLAEAGIDVRINGWTLYLADLHGYVVDVRTGAARPKTAPAAVAGD